jgi:hypothetical protein
MARATDQRAHQQSPVFWLVDALYRGGPLAARERRGCRLLSPTRIAIGAGRFVTSAVSTQGARFCSTSVARGLIEASPIRPRWPQRTIRFELVVVGVILSVIATSRRNV